MTTQARTTTFDTLSIEEASDHLSESNILETMDLGSALVHRVIHPGKGELIIVMPSAGKSAIIHV